MITFDNYFTATINVSKQNKNKIIKLKTNKQKNECLR